MRKEPAVIDQWEVIRGNCK